MKAPRASGSNVVPMRDPLEGIPPQYLAMAAAHMMKLGKQVFENQPQDLQAVPPVINAPSQ